VSKEKEEKRQRRALYKIIGHAYSSRGVQAQDRLSRSAGKLRPVGALDGAASVVDGGRINTTPGVHSDGLAAQLLGDVGEA